MNSPGFVEALRKCADFFEAHPDVPAPRHVQCDVWLKDIKPLLHQLGSAQKIYLGSFFMLRKEFGPITVEWTVPRATVCRRVVTGVREVPAIPARTEETYEWQCDESLLTEPPDASESREASNVHS